MNATKRKFNTLIQGIGARSSPGHTPSDTINASAVVERSDSLHSSPQPSLSAPEPPATPSPASNSASGDAMVSSGPSPTVSEILNKRRRIGVLESTSGNDKRAGTTISNIVLKKYGSQTNPTGAKDSKPTYAPKYCPSDRDELIRRLGTFQELTEWTPKPDRVNEIEWAKRGWVCQGKERVRCTLCNKELVVKINKREVQGKETSATAGSDVEEAMVTRFAELIIEAHQEDCLWKKRGCDDSLLRLHIASPQTALASLRERYDDMCTRPTFLPYIFNLRLPPSLDLQTTKSSLPSTFFTDPASKVPNVAQLTPATRDVALALALTGWQGLTHPRIGPVPNSASCATCLRKLGLWMFKSKEVDEETGQVLVPAPMDHLDPVREHRFFCPWRNATAQRNPGSKAPDSKAAWEVLAQTLKNNAYLRSQAERSNQKTPRKSVNRTATSVPVTPVQGRGTETDENTGHSLVMLGPDMVEDEDEDAATRDAKDKERWARLRRVKSLFDTKNARRMRRALSRPGTASSGTRPDTAESPLHSTDVADANIS